MIGEAEEPPSRLADSTTSFPPAPDLILPHDFPFRIEPPSVGPAQPVQVPRLTISDRSHSFRKRFYPGVTARDWNDWRWQNRNRLKSLDALAGILRLTADEQDAIVRHRGTLPLGITPYYASLLDEYDPDQGLRRTVVPVGAEFIRTPGEADDPLGEDNHSPVPGLVHRYPDRVLFLVTGFCTTYCRYCTR